MNNQILIDTLFSIHDTKNQNYIEKFDLIKLLYNYPDKDVFKLIRETGDFDKTVPKTPIKNRLSEDGKVSTCNNKLKNGHKRISDFNLKIDSSMLNEDNVMNLTELMNKKTYDKYKTHRNSLGLTAQPFNIQPTTIDNKIKLIADLIYKRYGKNGRFEHTEFSQWIKLHKDFLNSFKDWFKLDIWASYFDYDTNRNLLSFHKKKPDLEGFIKTQQFKRYRKVKAYARLYENFLMIFQNEKDTIPYRVIVLKLLEISYNSVKRKILIEHASPKYPNIKLILPNEETFIEWKSVFNEFTGNVITKKYEWNNGSIIGKGKFSRVYKVKENDTDKEFALKLINKKILLDTERLVIINEANIMKVLNHANIIKLYQSVETHDFYYYILELVSGSDLYRYISKKKFLEEYEASWIMKMLFDTIDYIHNSGIMHRDLKPENIMLEFNDKDEIVKLKIIDFGFACFQDDYRAMKSRCGTLNYTAPEILLGDTYDYKVDMFALGVIMYFMVRGSLPFYSDDQYIIAKKTVDGDYEIDDGFFANVSESCKSLLKGLLEPDPRKRMSLSHAMTSDWIIKGELLKNMKQKR